MPRIAVGYDGSIEALRALDRAAQLAETDEPVTVVSVAPVHVGSLGPEPLGPVEVAEHQRRLADACEYLAERGRASQGVEGFGDPAGVIASQARELNADLVAVGSYDKNLVERLLLGSVSTALVHRAPCDVLVARGAKGDDS